MNFAGMAIGMLHDFFRTVGGAPTVQADASNPESLGWNFGMLGSVAGDRYVIESVRSEIPRLYDAAPNVQGRWDGKTTVCLHEAARKMLGRNLPAHAQKIGSCFPAGTMVLMADNTEKAIEEITAGDEICTHLGTARHVSRAMSREYTGNFIRLCIRGSNRQVTMTEEHPVLTVENSESCPNKVVFVPGKYRWVQAGQLSEAHRVLWPFGVTGDEEYQHLDCADYVPNVSVKKSDGSYEWTISRDTVRAKGGRRPLPRSISLDERFGRLLGLYLAEGSYEPHKLRWNFASDEPHYASEVVSLLQALFGLQSAISRPKDTVLTVTCNSSALAAVFSGLCGPNQYVLRVPAIAFKSPLPVKMAVLRGWLDGDGDVVCKKRNEKGWLKRQVRGVTASSGLAIDMQRIASLCGVRMSVRPRKKEAHQRVASNDVYAYGRDAKSIYPHLPEGIDQRRSSREYYITRHGFVLKIASIEEFFVERIPVYNLEIEEEHSYVANGMAAHNCGGHAGSRGLEILQCVQIATGGREEYKPISHAWPYFLARKEFGMLGRGEGVAGGSVPPVLAKYGALHRDESGDPSESDDGLAQQWGRSGAPNNLFQLALDNIVQHAALARNVEELADGLASGAVGIVSDMHGFAMERDSEGFCARRGQWAHYHVFSGVVVTPRGRKGIVYDQSWGEGVPGGPLLPGWPSNCFAIDFDAADDICKREDCHLVTGFDGWKLPPGPDDAYPPYYL